jgi:4-amino-4-deoxy-L-arabinose transferase-like glycosyltransferase
VRTPEWARRPVLWIAAAAALILAAVGGRYGLHRDEWYFVEAARHPALAYPDQPALVPLAAGGWYSAVAGNPWAFRLVPALAVAAMVVLTAATCRELGGSRPAQTVAAGCAATASTVLAAGHLFSTTIFDAALTAGAILLLVRAVRTGSRRDWMAWGVVLGVALNVKLLAGAVLACCLLASALVGPRAFLRTPGPYLGGVTALLLGTPVIWWQARHGWPQLHLAGAIAQGGSGTSTQRWLVLPMLVTVTGPLTFGIAVVGLVAAWRARASRWLAVAVLLFLGLVVVGGGKPYYLLGLVPLAFASAGRPVANRLVASQRNRRVVVGLLAANLTGGLLLTLPVLPVGAVNVLRQVNNDLGEQIGWPHLVDGVEAAQRRAIDDPRHTVILTRNYGEAGALAAARRAGRALLPVYSGHNGFGEWGPPPAGTTRVLWVGPAVDARRDEALGGGCRYLGDLGTAGVDNEERHAVVSVCPVGSNWQLAWASLRRLG